MISSSSLSLYAFMLAVHPADRRRREKKPPRAKGAPSLTERRLRPAWTPGAFVLFFYFFAVQAAARSAASAGRAASYLRPGYPITGKRSKTKSCHIRAPLGREVRKDLPSRSLQLFLSRRDIVPLREKLSRKIYKKIFRIA